MHVGMKEAVAEHLREEDLHAGARERRDVDALLPQRRHLRDRRAVHALHHHHALRAVVPVHLGHAQQRRALEIAPQLAGVAGLAHEVELLVEVARELRDDLARLEAAPVGPEPLDQRRGGVEQQQVLRDRRLDARAQHLDRDLAAVLQPREVHLRDRRAGHRLPVELQRTARRAACRASARSRPPPAPRRRAAPGPAACASSSAMSSGQQVAARREDLAELDEDRPQRLERLAQALRSRRAAARREQQQAPPPEGRHELVQPEAHADRGDARKPQQPSQGAGPALPGARARLACAPPPRRSPRARRAAPAAAAPRPHSRRRPRQDVAPRRAARRQSARALPREPVRGDVAHHPRQLLLHVPAQVAHQLHHLGREARVAGDLDCAHEVLLAARRREQRARAELDHERRLASPPRLRPARPPAIVKRSARSGGARSSRTLAGEGREPRRCAQGSAAEQPVRSDEMTKGHPEVAFLRAEIAPLNASAGCRRAASRSSRRPA